MTGLGGPKRQRPGVKDPGQPSATAPQTPDHERKQRDEPDEARDTDMTNDTKEIDMANDTTTGDLDDDKPLALAKVTDNSVTFITPEYVAEYVAAIKAEIPKRRRAYDPKDRTWTVYEPRVEQALGIARQFLHVVVEYQQPWCQTMFDALPERLHDGVYRSLMRCFQAEIGGDQEAAAQLVTEYQRRRTAS